MWIYIKQWQCLGGGSLPQFHPLQQKSQWEDAQRQCLPKPPLRICRVDSSREVPGVDAFTDMQSCWHIEDESQGPDWPEEEKTNCPCPSKRSHRRHVSCTKQYSHPQDREEPGKYRRAIQLFSLPLHPIWDCGVQALLRAHNWYIA